MNDNIIESYERYWAVLPIGLAIMAISGFIGALVSTDETILPAENIELYSEYRVERIAWYKENNLNEDYEDRSATTDADIKYKVKVVKPFFTPYTWTSMGVGLFFLLFPVLAWFVGHIGRWYAKGERERVWKRDVDREHYLKLKEMELKMFDPNYNPLDKE